MRLADGDVLYRDVTFPYPPLAPYVNAYLFRLFGTDRQTHRCVTFKFPL